MLPEETTGMVKMSLNEMLEWYFDNAEFLHLENSY